jgi:hypothetical protein
LRGEAKDDLPDEGRQTCVEFSADAAFRHRFLLAEEASEGVRPSTTGYFLIFSNKTGKKKLNPPL